MSELIVLSDLNAAEATTLTTKIAALVDQAVADAKQQNQPSISASVLEKKAALVAAAESLHVLSSTSASERWAVDQANDRILAGLHNTLQGFVQALSSPRYALNPAQQQLLGAATLLLDELFANGTGFLRKSYSTQYGTMRLMLARSKEAHCQQATQTLGLQPVIEMFQTAAEEYGRTMGYTTASLQPGLMDAWSEALEGYLAAVISAYGRNSTLRSLFLSPYHQVREQIRKRRAAQERQQEKAPETSQTQPSPTPPNENPPSR
ncbi:hypothetical protein L6R29_25170 [Myxococcota bacterium]|nr:hypothetical protein [Myxococcota bacterium]